MSRDNMGLLEYIAELEKEEAKLREVLKENEIAQAHARRVIERGGMVKAVLPSGSPSGQDPEETAKPASGPYSGMGTEQAALLCLQGSPKALKTAGVAERLQEGGIQSEAERFQATVYSALSRLVDKGEIAKIGSGRKTRWATPEHQRTIEPWLLGKAD